MKILIVGFLFLSTFSMAQENIDKTNYLNSYGINKDSIQELVFKNKERFNSFVSTFEEKEGFRLQFLIFDESGNLIKHKLDKHIKECGKGDVEKLRKKYHKKLPSIIELNSHFTTTLNKPEINNFTVIFVWMQEQELDTETKHVFELYHQHAFETYHIWKENNNIEFYFLDMNYKSEE
tara:strand:+ start:57 stop:590 length:534 start_codon:yes stop_codon:yes gene_type:complete